MIWPEQILKLDDLELSLVPHIGGRLMDVRYRGTSLLFQNPDLLDQLPDLDNLSEHPSRATHLSFPLWGGEKTWLSPDSEWPHGAPHPVLDSGQYSIEIQNQRAATMRSDICPHSNMQIVRNVCLIRPNQWTIRHQVTNKGQTARKVGLWSVMMTKAPANYFFRLAEDKTPSVVFGDPQQAFSFSNKIGQISCNTQHEFKLGVHPKTGFTAARIPTDLGLVWIANTGIIQGDTKNYAHGHALEFYNSAHYEYGELEWHSAALLLAPEQHLVFTLNYHLFLQPANCSAHEMFEHIEKHCQGKQ